VKNQSIYSAPAKLAAAFLLALCSLFFFSCDGNGSAGGSNYKSVAYDLRGTWVSNETGEYSGTLVISGNTITIGGYDPNTLYEWTNGTGCRPFKDFTKNVPLEGYTEEGKIFIKDVGIVQEGLPYTYWDAYSPDDYKRIYLLTFNFGGRNETLRKQ
jgi:hypothetical protein